MPPITHSAPRKLTSAGLLRTEKRGPSAGQRCQSAPSVDHQRSS